MWSVCECWRCPNTVFLSLPLNWTGVLHFSTQMQANPCFQGIYFCSLCHRSTAHWIFITRAGQSDLPQETAYRCLARMCRTGRNTDVCFGYRCGHCTCCFWRTSAPIKIQLWVQHCLSSPPSCPHFGALVSSQVTYHHSWWNVIFLPRAFATHLAFLFFSCLVNPRQSQRQVTAEPHVCDFACESDYSDGSLDNSLTSTLQNGAICDATVGFLSLVRAVQP